MCNAPRDTVPPSIAYSSQSPIPPDRPLSKCGNLAGGSGIVGIPAYADADDLFQEPDISGVLECALAQ
jgi:hypothetical protein